MFDVALDWTKCPDGVELVDFGEPPPATANLSAANAPFALVPRAGLHFRTRSERRVSMRVEAVDLEQPLLLRFINTADATDLAAFFGRFGMPFETDHEEVRPILDLRATLTEYVESCMEVASKERASILNGLFEHMTLRPEFDYSDKAQKGRVALYAENMMKFMSAEFAVAVLSDVHLVRCANCNDAFFVGPAAARRADAKTCSNKCRVALMRRKDGPSGRA